MFQVKGLPKSVNGLPECLEATDLTHWLGQRFGRENIAGKVYDAGLQLGPVRQCCCVGRFQEPALEDEDVEIANIELASEMEKSDVRNVYPAIHVEGAAGPNHLRESDMLE